MNTNFLRSGGFMQTENGEFLVFLGQDLSSCALDEAKNLIEQGKAVLYRPKYWDFLNCAETSFYKIGTIKVYTPEQFSQFVFQQESSLSSDKGILWSSDNRNKYSEQFQWSMEQFKNGRLKKSVPIHQFYGSAQFDLRQLILKVLNQKRDGYFYGHWDIDYANNFSGCLGISPERFLQAKIETKQMSTSALAGTWKKNEVPDRKINEEHDFVVQDILEQLGSEELTQKSDSYVCELKTFNHLKTDFNYIFKTTESLIQKLRSLHPTSALGIYPRYQDMYQELQHLGSQSQREFHGAPFGCFFNKQLQSLVAIRNIQWKNSNLSIFAGGGVTAESIFEHEWEELMMKKQSVVSALGLE